MFDLAIDKLALGLCALFFIIMANGERAIA